MWGHNSLMNGVAIFSGVASGIASYRENKARKAWTKYNNAMINIGNALNQNAITTNQLNTVTQSTSEGIGIERQRLMSVADAEVAAAAAGTAGRSVNQTIDHFHRAADEAQKSRMLQLEQSIESYKTQRVNSNYQAIVQQDHTPTYAGTSALMSALGTGVKVTSNILKSRQT